MPLEPGYDACAAFARYGARKPDDAGGAIVDVKQAIAKARSYLTVIFSDKGVSEMRLEEVEYDRPDDAWLITFGLLRPSIRTKLGQVDAIMGTAPLTRAYKIVRIPND